MMTKSKSRPRLLCLHGARSNDEITSLQLIGLDLYEKFDCHCLHAPHVTGPASRGLEDFTDGPYYAWSDPCCSGGMSKMEEQWDESLVYLAEYCKRHGPFDGVYGFSQGAAMITNFSYPAMWKTRFGMSTRPWKFAILACGTGGHNITTSSSSSSSLGGCASTAASKIDMPSFHIFGRKDRHMNDGRAMSDRWTDIGRVAHVHGSGHEIDVRMHAREKEMMRKLRIFLDVHAAATDDRGIADVVRSALCSLHMPEFYLGGYTFGRRTSDSEINE